MASDERTGDEPIQRTWPELTCWGCGPANDDGIQLESYLVEGEQRLVATVEPDDRFTSGAPNVVYGGYVASLIDCHSMWTAIAAAYDAEDRPVGSSPRIAYVTADLSVEFRRPTPLDRPIHLAGQVDGDAGPRTVVRTELGPDDETTATGTVRAVRIDPGDFEGHHSDRP